MVVIHLHRRLAPAVAVVASVLAGGVASGPAAADGPAVVNGGAVRPVILQSMSRRIDMVGFGDSNLTFRVYGWHGGLERALVEAGFPMYATGLRCQNEFGGGGYGYGIRYLEDFWNGARGLRAGALDALDAHGSRYVGSTTPFMNHMYCNVSADIATNGFGNSGLKLEPAPDDAIGIEDDLRFHLCYGLFEGAGDGRLRLQFRDRVTGDQLAVGPDLPTEGAPATTMAVATLDLPAGPRPNRIQARQMAHSPDVTWLGRIFTLYHRVENLSRPAGFSFSGWGDHPSRSLRHLANLLINDERVTDTYKQYFLGQMRRLQTGDPIVVFWINHGFNDRNEWGVDSVGPLAQAGNPQDSRTKAGYKDNMQGAMNQILADWTAGGGLAENAYFVLMPSHRTGDGDDTDVLLEDYRDACRELAVENPRTAAVIVAELITAAEMHAAGYYDDNDFGAPHLEPAGYDEIARRALEALLDAPPCPADLDGNGQVGFGDLLAVLGAWGPCAGCPEDLDGSGAAGFSDLLAVLGAWGVCP